MEREESILLPPRVRRRPGYIPRVLLDGLQYPSLVGTHSILAANVSGLVHRSMSLVVKAPPVPRPLALIVRVGLGTIGGNCSKDLRRLVAARQHVIERVAL